MPDDPSIPPPPDMGGGQGSTVPPPPDMGDPANGPNGDMFVPGAHPTVQPTAAGEADFAQAAAPWQHLHDYVKDASTRVPAPPTMDEPSTAAAPDDGLGLSPLFRNTIGAASSGVYAAAGALGHAVGLHNDFLDMLGESPATSATGNLIHTTAQYLTGAAAISAAAELSGGAALGGLLGIPKGVKLALQMGTTGAFAFDPHQGHLADYLKQAPFMEGPVTELMASKPGDSDAVDRFKGFLENASFGPLGDLLTARLTLMRDARPLFRAGEWKAYQAKLAQTADFANDAFAKAYPGGAEPAWLTAKNLPTRAAVIQGLKDAQVAHINTDFHIPLGGGTSSETPRSIYLDKEVPRSITVSGKTIDPTPYLALHEASEQNLMRTARLPYGSAHQIATRLERHMVEANGLNWAEYSQQLAPWLREAQARPTGIIPGDLDTKPYDQSGLSHLIKERYPSGQAPGESGHSPGVSADAHPLLPNAGNIDAIREKQLELELRRQQSGVLPDAPPSTTEEAIAREKESIKAAMDSLRGENALPGTAVTLQPGERVAPAGATITPTIVPQDMPVAKQQLVKSILRGPEDDMPTSSPFNLTHLITGIGADNALTALAEASKSEIARVTQGTISHEETARAGDILGLSPTRMLTRVKALAGSTDQAHAIIYGGRRLLAAQLRDIHEIATLHAVAQEAGTLTPTLTKEFDQAITGANSVMLALKGAQTNIARSLSSMQIPTSGAGVKSLLAAQTPKDLSSLARAIAAIPPSDVESISGLVRAPMRTRAFNVAMDAYRNNILGLKTGGRIALSGIVNGVLTPMAMASGGESRTAMGLVAGSLHAAMDFLRSGTRWALDAARTGDLMGSITHRSGSWEDWKSGRLTMPVEKSDMFSATANAVLTGESTIKTGSLPTDDAGRHLQPGEGWGEHLDLSHEGAREALNYLGHVIGVPGRVVAGADELIKQIAYRSHVVAHATMEGHSLGLAGDELTDHIKSAIDNAYQYGGGANNDPGAALGKSLATEEMTPEEQAALHEKAGNSLEYARRMNFTQEFDNSQGQLLGSSIQRIAQDHPFLQVILPFQRTPANIANAALAHLPGLNGIARSFRADLAAGGELAAVARGRSRMGGALLTTAGVLAYSGMLTGSGPSDPAQRKVLLASGWKPNSLVIPHADGAKTYVSLDGLEPIKTVIGITADVANAMRRAPNAPVDPSIADQAQKVSSACLLALCRNGLDQSYFSGAVRALNAAVDGDANAAERAVRGFVSDMIPRWPGQAAGAFNPDTIDPVHREIRSMADALMQRIPGMSSSLPPLRDHFGKPVPYTPDAMNNLVPIGWSNAAPDPVNEELLRLGFRPPPFPTRSGDVPLSPSQQDKFAEIFGTVTDGSKNNIRGAVSQLINSEKYQRMTDGSDGLPGSRYVALQSLFGDFWARAEKELRRRDPSISAQDRIIKQAQVNSLRPKPQSPLTQAAQSLLGQPQQ